MNDMSLEEELDDHILKHGGCYSAWYIGVAINPRKRLFEGHNVNEQSGSWFYRDAGSPATAKAIEGIFMKKGCKSGTDGKDSPHYVYTYKMTRSTWASKN